MDFSAHSGNGGASIRSGIRRHSRRASIQCLRLRAQCRYWIESGRSPVEYRERKGSGEQRRPARRQGCACPARKPCGNRRRAGRRHALRGGYVGVDAGRGRDVGKTQGAIQCARPCAVGFGVAVQCNELDAAGGAHHLHRSGMDDGRDACNAQHQQEPRQEKTRPDGGGAPSVHGADYVHDQFKESASRVVGDCNLCLPSK